MGPSNSKSFFLPIGCMQHTCAVWVHPISDDFICFHWDAHCIYHGLFKAPGRDELLSRAMDWEDLGRPENWFSLENGHSIFKLPCSEEKYGIHRHDDEDPRVCIKAKLTKANLIKANQVKQPVDTTRLEKAHLYLVSFMSSSDEHLYHPVARSF